MKRIWQEKRKEKGLSIHEPGPNIVMGANAQVALEKFARYFDVECRLVPISKESHYRLDPVKAMQFVDENTIGVFVILGSTYTGHYEPVKEMAELLDEYEKQSGVSVPCVLLVLRPLSDSYRFTQDSRRRRLRWVCRPVRDTQVRVGFQDSQSRVHQYLRA